MKETRSMNERLTESELIEASRAGDDSAFEELFRRNQRRVYSVALNFFGGNSQTAEDITQQAFLKLYRGLKAFRGDAMVSTWLYRVTVNLCIDERKRGGRFEFLRDLLGPRELGSAASVEPAAESIEVSEEVRKALLEIRPEYRMPIILKHVEGMTYAEMADVLELPEGTVASRLSRGHRILAEKLEHLKDKVH